MMKEEKMDELNIDNIVYKTRLSVRFRNLNKYQPEDKGKIFSFIPGTIVEVIAKVGETIEPGGELLVLEAMKMKNRINSPVGGVIKAIHVEEGDVIPRGYLLVELELPEPEED